MWGSDYWAAAYWHTDYWESNDPVPVETDNVSVLYRIINRQFVPRMERQ